MNETQIITRKIILYPLGNKEEVNRVYKYIRDGMYNQNKAMNQYMSSLYVAKMKEISEDDRRELNGLYTRISTSKKGSAYTDDIQFAKGLGTTGEIRTTVQNKFKNSIKDGLLYGKVSLPTYKMTNPLLVCSRYIDFYYNYESYTEFLEHLYENDLEVFMKFVNGITFKLVFGNVKKSHELRHVIQYVFEESYKVCGSSIGFDKTDKKIVLNLSLKIPVKEHELDEDVVVGVDVGVKVPAMCALNNNKYARSSIGSAEDFIRVRTKIQAQRRRLQHNLKNTNGGHGRKKKLEPLDKFKQYESNFVPTYNHMVSKRVVDFALKNNAKYINIENLKGYGEEDKNKFILRNWSYYQLQEYITYKAKLHGIEVRKINPYHTSQKCSCCGYEDAGNRPKDEKGQSYFKCLKCGAEMNADFNAARNIAMSTDWMEDKTTLEEKRKRHENSNK